MTTTVPVLNLGRARVPSPLFRARRRSPRRFPFDQQLLPIEINMSPRFGKPLRPQPFMTLCALARRAQRGRGGSRLAMLPFPAVP